MFKVELHDHQWPAELLVGSIDELGDPLRVKPIAPVVAAAAAVHPVEEEEGPAPGGPAH